MKTEPFAPDASDDVIAHASKVVARLRLACLSGMHTGQARRWLLELLFHDLQDALDHNAQPEPRSRVELVEMWFRHRYGEESDPTNENWSLAYGNIDSAIRVAADRLQAESEEGFADSRAVGGCGTCKKSFITGGNRYFLVVSGPLHAVSSADGRSRDIRLLAAVSTAGVQQENASQTAAHIGRVWNLPAPRNAVFTGRRDVLDALGAVSDQAKRPRIDVLTGLSGIGKTQIALQYAFEDEDRFDVIWWIRGRDSASARDDLRSLARALFLADDTTSTPDALARVRDRLETSTRWLLLFDDAPDAQSVADYLPRSGGGQTLITSVNELGWTGIGNVQRVEPLPSPEAADFMRRRCRSSSDGAEELSAEMGHLPLALELAGAYIEQSGTTFREYLQLFRKHRATLLRDTQSHLSPVVTTWKMSLQEVAKVDGRAVDLLLLASHLASAPIPRAVFELWFWRELSETSASQDLETELRLTSATAALRRYSLLSVHAGTLSVHELLQSAVRETAHPKKRRRFESTALHLVDDLFAVEEADWFKTPLAALLLPHIPVVTAVPRLTSSPMSIHLLTALARFHDHRGAFDDAAAKLEDAATRARQGNAPSVIRLDILTRLCAAYRMARRYTDMFDAADRSLEIASNFTPTTAEERRVFVDFLNTHSAIATQGGEPLTGEALAKRALSILGGKDIFKGELAVTYTNLGTALRDLGRYDAAAEKLRLATELDRQTYGTSHFQVARDLNALGLVYLHAETFEAARGPLYESWQMHLQHIGDRHPMTLKAASDYASVLLALGEYEAALELHTAALATGAALHIPPHDVAALLNGRALALEQLGRYPEALRDIDEAIGLATGCNDPRLSGFSETREHILESRRLASEETAGDLRDDGDKT